MWLVCLGSCVLVGSGYLEPRVLGSCVLVRALLVRVVRAGWKWLPICLKPRVPGSCPGWCGYLHALNLVSLVRVLGWCVLVGVVTCIP